MQLNKRNKNERGFVLVFVIAIVAALSVMTTSINYYYDSDLKSVSRNSVMQQVMLAAETGLQEGQNWVTKQLNSNSFDLVDIQNDLKTDNSDNKCLNRHGFTNTAEDVYYARRIVGTLGSDDRKFENMSFEVYVQRHADVVKSVYFSAQGDKGEAGRDTTYSDRSFALVERFKDFPTDQFTIEMWIKNKQPTASYNMHAFEWGREWDLVFKVLNDEWSPRLGEVTLDDQGDVGTPIKDKWVHIAWVWDGGDEDVDDTGNVRIYQNGELVGTFNADVGAREKSGYTNPKERLPLGDYWPLAIGEGLHGFSPSDHQAEDAKPVIQSVPWLGNIAEFRLWNFSRSADDIKKNNRKRLTGGEPGLVSYYKFNEGSGNTAIDYNTSRPSDRRNDATVYGVGTKGTKWETELVKYDVVSTTDDAPEQNVPPGEDVVYYKIMSCGIGPDGQLIPLELIVSAPVQQGDVGDGKVALTTEDIGTLEGQEASPLKIGIASKIADPNDPNDINIEEDTQQNTNFFVFKRSMEQCTNSTTFAAWDETASYSEGACAIVDGRTYMVEKDAGATTGTFNEDEWEELLGSGCDGVRFMRSGEASHGHYYKYFSTAPNSTPQVTGDAVTWREARRRAENSTCGGMRGYLLSVDTANENNFIRDAVMNDVGTAFHLAAGETRENYYGSRLNSRTSQHYIWIANSDFRTPGTMRIESGPNLGEANSLALFQSGEPNGVNGIEDFTDMEINRSGRVNGRWNDLPNRPTCYSGGLDCITGYVVEYGGFDYFRLDHNPAGTVDDVTSSTKVCYARATIQEDTYVEGEDFLRYDTTADDAPSTIVADTSTASDSDLDEDGGVNTNPGWDEPNGVLTLIHTDIGTASDSTVKIWSHNTTYANNQFVWFNNRVWQNVSGGNLNTSTATRPLQTTPTPSNPDKWRLISGNESNAPCAALSEWQQAFESIKYYNANVTEAVDGNPWLDAENGTQGSQTEGTNTASLGERTILFSMGPLHVTSHIDGFNHFYEFYEFPTKGLANPSGSDTDVSNMYVNKNNRRWSHGFDFAHRLSYLGKTGYLANITSEEENNVVTEKAVGTGWLGGMTQDQDQDTNADVDRCGGLHQNTARQTDAWRAVREIDALSWTNGNGTPVDGDGIANNNRSFFRNEIAVNNGSNVTGVTVARLSSSRIRFTTSSNHELLDDEIIRVSAGANATIRNNNLGLYRIRVTSNTQFLLLDLDDRSFYTQGTGFTYANATYNTVGGLRSEVFEEIGTDRVISQVDITTERITTSTDHGLSTDDFVWIRNATGGVNIPNGIYRVSSVPTNTTLTIASLPEGSGQINLSGAYTANSGTLNTAQLVWKDPDVHWTASGGDQISHTECTYWRWVTGPEQFLWNNRGLGFSNARQFEAVNENAWTRSRPTGQQIGEMFGEDGAPYRNWQREFFNEPNNCCGTSATQGREPVIHLIGDQFCDQRRAQGQADVDTDDELASCRIDELRWNDLLNYDRGEWNMYGARGLVIEYGGLENDIDPITRISTTRVIKIENKVVSRATIKIYEGKQTGDTLNIEAQQITDSGLTVSGNGSGEITISGQGLCENYLDLIKQATLDHNGLTGGIRKVEVTIGDVTKPDNQDYYLQLVSGSTSYTQANFQSTFKNICGLQGYLAPVTIDEDLDAIRTMGVSSEKHVWINGTDEQVGGTFAPGFWRYTSGPFTGKEFWRRTATPNRDVRVGPFEDNWAANRPNVSATDNYLTYFHSDTAANRLITTQPREASDDVEGYIVRFGGSVGDFEDVDLEEDGNEFDIKLGPIRAEISFYDDGSDNTIFINGEDSVDVSDLDTGWSESTSFSSTANSQTAMVITPPSGVVTMAKWQEELAKVFYQNKQLSNFTPGNRKIKIVLVYGDTSLNQTVGIIKSIGSRNQIVVTPISWNNR